MRRGFAGCAVFSLTLMLAAASGGCQGMPGPASPEERTVLFNGRDLEGWVLYVADLNVDVHDVWSVRKGVVHCEGKPNGYMRTAGTYRNYHLHVEWRWAEKPANSGVLLHCTGPDQVWPRCIEAQLQSGNAGDFVMIRHSGLTVGGRRYHDDQQMYVVAAKKEASTENAPGEWNSYDIYCDDDTIKVYVNGMLQNEGTQASPASGWIGLQSEGGPIEFRNIYLMPVE